jgi:hypothetical protein
VPLQVLRGFYLSWSLQFPNYSSERDLDWYRPPIMSFVSFKCVLTASSSQQGSRTVVHIGSDLTKEALSQTGVFFPARVVKTRRWLRRPKGDPHGQDSIAARG